MTEPPDWTPEEYWRAFVPWLGTKPLAERVALLQQCVQEFGPMPDDLRPRIDALLGESADAS